MLMRLQHMAHSSVPAAARSNLPSLSLNVSCKINVTSYVDTHSKYTLDLRYTFLMSSYKLFKSFWANVKGSLGLASLCIVLQQHDCSVGSSNWDLCLQRNTTQTVNYINQLPYESVFGANANMIYGGYMYIFQ